MSALQEAGVRVVLVEQVPEHQALVPTLLARAAATGQPVQDLTLNKATHLARQAYVVSQFGKLGGENLIRIDPADKLCPKKHCLMSDQGDVLYNDYQHVTTKGARLLRPLFEAEFQRMAAGE